MIMKILFRKQKIPINSWNSFLNRIINGFFKIPNETLEWWWILSFEIKLTLCKMMVTMGCREGCTSLSRAKFGWLVKTMSIQDDEWWNICGCERINAKTRWCNCVFWTPWWCSCINSPKIVEKLAFDCINPLSMFPNSEMKSSNSLLLWLGELYITATHPFLF